MLTVITPTGDRPLAFSLCKRWMENQTHKPDQWIVIDDGKQSMDLQSEGYLEYVRREPVKTDPKHTLVVNVATAIPKIKGDKVIFWEDDEYYAPEFLEVMNHHLDKFQVVGIGWAKYYHIRTGGWVEHQNMNHASLAQTGFQMSVLSMVQMCIDRGMEKEWLDCQIWDETMKSKTTISHLIFRDERKPLYVGIKGLPGRNGIGIGHKIETYKNHDDKGRSKLISWVQKDYQVYLNVLKEIGI